MKSKKQNDMLSDDMLTDDMLSDDMLSDELDKSDESDESNNSSHDGIDASKKKSYKHPKKYVKNKTRINITDSNKKSDQYSEMCKVQNRSQNKSHNGSQNSHNLHKLNNPHKRDLIIPEEYNDRIFDYVYDYVKKLKLDMTKRDFYCIDEIGKGTYGRIYLCEIMNAYYVEKLKNDIFVVKVLRKNRILQNDVYIEIFLQSILKHPKIVKCHGWFEDDKYYFMIIDHINGPDLFDKMVEIKEMKRSKRMKKFLSDDVINNYLLQLIDILEYLKVNNVVHRDLKPENILTNDSGDIFLCDFGLATILKNSVDTNGLPTVNIDTRTVGTIEFMAPETFDKKYGTGTDLWSFGIIIYELIYKTHPFRNVTIEGKEDNISEKIRNIEIKYNDKDPKFTLVNDLLRGILVPYQERITLKQCCLHSFFMEYQ